MKSFVHLHLHSEYSLLDGTISRCRLSSFVAHSHSMVPGGFEVMS